MSNEGPYYTVTHWRDYQHYRDRNPPWIKLHFSLLSSRDWVMLDDASRVLAVACMLIASRNDGRVPADPDYVKRVAYLNKRPNFNPLIECGFLDDASGCKQMLADARPEERQRRDRDRGETEENRASARRSRRANKTAVPDDYKPSERVIAWAKEKGYGRLPEHCESFVRKCAANGYRYADHDAAFMEAVRSDWAGLGVTVGAPVLRELPVTPPGVRPPPGYLRSGLDKPS